VAPIKREEPSALDHVEIVKPGASYNPSFEDHQKLLQEAVDEQIKNREEFDKVMNPMKRKRRRKKNKEIEDSGDVEDSSEMQDSESDEEKEHVNIQIIPRLTQADR